MPLRQEREGRPPRAAARRVPGAAGEVASLRSVLDLVPGDARAAIFLAQILASHHDPALRDGAEAVRIARQVCETSRFEHIPALDALGAAYAESGDFDKAIESVQRAIALAQSKDQQRLASSLSDRLRLYEQGQPFRRKP